MVNDPFVRAGAPPHPPGLRDLREGPGSGPGGGRKGQVGRLEMVKNAPNEWQIRGFSGVASFWDVNIIEHANILGTQFYPLFGQTECANSKLS